MRLPAPRRAGALALATGLLLYPMPVAAAANERGAQLAAICRSCHRLDGREHGIPAIVGIDSTTLVATMRAYRSGQRQSQIMRAVAISLTDEEIGAVARYLAAQTRGAAP